MKTDIQGCSTCLPGQEHYEEFTVNPYGLKTKKIQYDYRTLSGRLFSCVADDLQEARRRRDLWLSLINESE